MNIKSWKAWRVLAIGFILLSILAGFPLSSKGAEPIKIGVIQPITGPIAFDGQNQVKAIELAVEKINSEGGVLGRQIKLIIEDGKALPTESKSAALKLIVQDKVCAILGCWASSATLAVMPLLDEQHIPMINGTSTSDKITNPNTPGWYWTFRLLAPHQITAEDVVPALVKLGFNKDMGYLAFSNEWGRNVVPNFKRQFEKFNVKDVFEEYFGKGKGGEGPLPEWRYPGTFHSDQAIL
jgi:branched-chain amino acid transport system substrate-binding protein